jgi:pilus assembly protein TadC
MVVRGTYTMHIIKIDIRLLPNILHVEIVTARTTYISFLRVMEKVSLTYIRSKKRSLTKPSLSAKLKLRVICLFFFFFLILGFYFFSFLFFVYSSRPSSTMIRNFELPNSSRIIVNTLLFMTCKISFWIECEVYLTFLEHFLIFL